ncbi:MAG TPA: class II aldolase/adducin family protein [Candidatus Angelobacter sp.]|nr:class II aldolase/adducin family protein [Candidatus Angelobacter sp.]
MSIIRKIMEGAAVLPFVRLPLTGRPLDAESNLRQDLVEHGRMLHAMGFVAATDGNLSVRMDQDRVMITPSGVSKGMMRPDDMVIVNLNGAKISGACRPSSEINMHLTIYRMRPDVGAVVHAHPCTATAFASCGIALDQPLCSEIVITLGEVPLAPYATTGSMELSDSLAPYVPDHDAILMANHGVVTYGADLRQAYLRMEAVEHYAKIVLAARQLGTTQTLNQTQLEALVAARSRYRQNGH